MPRRAVAVTHATSLVDRIQAQPSLTVRSDSRPSACSTLFSKMITSCDSLLRDAGPHCPLRYGDAARFRTDDGTAITPIPQGAQATALTQTGRIRCSESQFLRHQHRRICSGSRAACRRSQLCRAIGVPYPEVHGRFRRSSLSRDRSRAQRSAQLPRRRRTCPLAP